MVCWQTWIHSDIQTLDWLQILAHHLVLGVGHEAIKVSLLRLQIVCSELLDEHASWGHSDLTVGEKRGSVWSDNSHFTCGQRWHYAVHMARPSAVVCVGWCAFLFSYHPGVPAALQEWNKSLGEDVHAWERRGEHALPFLRRGLTASRPSFLLRSHPWCWWQSSSPTPLRLAPACAPCTLHCLS